MNPEHGCESPLILACIAAGGKVGKAQTVRVLIEAGADLRARDSVHKMTALHWAVTCCFKNVVEVLLQHGASATSVIGKPPTKLRRSSAASRWLAWRRGISSRVRRTTRRRRSDSS